MPKAIKKRIPRKTADTESEVREKLTGLKETIKEKKKTVLKFGIVIIAILAALTVFFVNSYNSRLKAKSLEYDGYKIYYSNPRAQAPDREELYKKALGIFKKAYAIRKSTFSLFYIAACYYDLGKYDDALKALKDFMLRYPNDELYTPLVYQKMVLTYEKKGDVREAGKTLDSLYNLKGYIYKDFALMEYGKLLEKEGKMEEARKKYEELVKKFPGSPFSNEAKAKLAGKKNG
jgi:predicted negative regulator of RcsB-dependent stress response